MIKSFIEKVSNRILVSDYLNSCKLSPKGPEDLLGIPIYIRSWILYEKDQIANYLIKRLNFFLIRVKTIGKTGFDQVEFGNKIRDLLLEREMAGADVAIDIATFEATGKITERAKDVLSKSVELIKSISPLIKRDPVKVMIDVSKLDEMECWAKRWKEIKDNVDQKKNRALAFIAYQEKQSRRWPGFNMVNN